MKINIFCPLFVLALFVVTACQEGASVSPTSDDAVQFADVQGENIYLHYLDLQQALADSDPARASAAATKLNGEFSLNQIELRYLARHIAVSKDLEIQRRYFFPMTDQLEPVFSKRMTQGTIFRMHCPMANKGAGADWYSGVNAVHNPYLGNATPACGHVVAQIRGRG